MINGSETAEDYVGSLPGFGDENVLKEGWTAIKADAGIMIRQTDFYFTDGSQGSAFIIININQMGPVLKSWIRDLCVLCVLILSFCALFLGAWLYMGILGPLSQLRAAARKISAGNLDFTVSGSSITEFDEVCADFEEMRKQLKSSRDEKVSVDNSNRELISNITHDLKTPITSIKGYCEGIMDGVADSPEKMEKYIHTIYNKAIDMDRLINELSVYSRIDTNRMMYNFTKIGVRAYFDDCAEDLQFELESENVEMSYTNSVSESAIMIGDPEQLARVIHNIISNSVKYMDKDRKKISIRISEEGDFIKAEFEDNGKGIAKQDLGKIFDRFYRTDASRNSSKGGSGIGLSIVKKIMEDHGGKVWALSTEGEGTTICFIIRKYMENEAAQ